MSAEPFYNKLRPLRFRAISDFLAQSHLEASECCLVHVDNPLSSAYGVWLNPNVRVGYNESAYRAVHDESGGLSSYAILTGLWKNRLLRWATHMWTKSPVAERTLRASTAGNPDFDSEPGKICLAYEMQVLDARGWLHV